MYDARRRLLSRVVIGVRPRGERLRDSPISIAQTEKHTKVSVSVGWTGLRYDAIRYTYGGEKTVGLG